jgi:hypothetical protein
MILAICGFWQCGQEALYMPNHLMLSKIVANILKACHWSVMFVMVLKNPGIVSSDRMTVLPDVDDDKKFRRTRPCEPCLVISRKVEHCERCDVCMEEVDHHCPWMNKCVAKGNLTEFYLFLAFTFGSLFYALGISIAIIS